MSNWLIGFSEGTWVYQLRRLDVLGFRPGNSEFVRTARSGDCAFAYVAGGAAVKGLFRIAGPSYVDGSSLYREASSSPDMYSVRFPVDALWVSPPGSSVEMRKLVGDLALFSNLSDQRAWGGVMRNLPLRLADVDARALQEAIAVANQGFELPVGEV